MIFIEPRTLWRFFWVAADAASTVILTARHGIGAAPWFSDGGIPHERAVRRGFSRQLV
jgi:hypothetical protein